MAPNKATPVGREVEQFHEPLEGKLSRIWVCGARGRVPKVLVGMMTTLTQGRHVGG